ncbi:MAG: amidohydrolase family protein, partial [Rhodospirillaceae bacterium]|nr:amidohydrolase family protein [Rhodospirillaceae bacterium]
NVLAAQAAYPAVRGIRSKPRTSATAASRDRVQGQPVSMQDPAWRTGLGLLRQHGLSWDLRVPYWHLSEAAEVCALYPDLAIVVEHTGLSWDRGEDGLAEWRRGMTALAAMEHVHLKISELGLAGAPWDYHDNRLVVREAIEIFGFQRCMFASNFPVAGLRIGYVDQVSAIAHMIRDCSTAERTALFHDTAKHFYRL